MASGAASTRWCLCRRGQRRLSLEHRDRHESGPPRNVRSATGAWLAPCERRAWPGAVASGYGHVSISDERPHHHRHEVLHFRLHSKAGVLEGDDRQVLLREVADERAGFDELSDAGYGIE